MPNGQRNIGRREIDIWREHQLKRCEEFADKLELLLGEMREDEVNTLRYWTKRIETELDTYRRQS